MVEPIGKDRTYGTYNHEEWLAWRRTGVGGSDAPVIMGLSSYKGWLALYTEKLDLGLDPREPTEAAYWGQRLEGMVAAEFETRARMRVVEPTDPLVRHPDRPWQIGTPDRFVHDPATGKVVGILECKTAGARSSEQWEDGPAPTAVCQLQHYLAVTGLPVGWIAVLLGGQRYRHFEVPRDDAYIAELTKEEARFWSHVVSRTPPEPDGLDATTAIVNSRFETAIAESSVELPPHAVVAWSRLVTLTTAAEMVEVDRLRNVVKLALGDREVGTVDGQPVVSWRQQSMNRVDVKALREAHPELADQYTRTTSSRVFRMHRRYQPGDPQYSADD